MNVLRPRTTAVDTVVREQQLSTTTVPYEPLVEGMNNEVPLTT